MALALGYLLASVRQETSGLLTGAALAILFLGMLAKLLFSVAFHWPCGPKRLVRRARWHHGQNQCGRCSG